MNSKGPRGRPFGLHRARARARGSQYTVGDAAMAGDAPALADSYRQSLHPIPYRHLAITHSAAAIPRAATAGGSRGSCLSAADEAPAAAAAQARDCRMTSVDIAAKSRWQTRGKGCGSRTAILAHRLQRAKTTLLVFRTPSCASIILLAWNRLLRFNKSHAATQPRRWVRVNSQVEIKLRQWLWNFRIQPLALVILLARSSQFGSPTTGLCTRAAHKGGNI